MNKAFKKKVKTYFTSLMVVESTKFVDRGSSLMVGETLLSVIRVIDNSNLIVGVRVR